MERELKNTVQSKVKEQVLKGLVENNDVDLPSAMVKQEIDGLRRQAMQRFGDNQAQMPELLKLICLKSRRKNGLRSVYC